MRSKKPLGTILVAIGCVVPAVVYVSAKIAIRIDSSYGGPPNQGAMVLAGMAVVSSIIIGLPVTAVGVYFLARSNTPLKQPGKGLHRNTLGD